MPETSMIILIRHCTPIINYELCSYKSAREKVQEYNNTSNLAVEEISSLKFYLNDFLQSEQLTVFTSSLPRAYITAKYIFSEKQKIVSSNKFVEFDLDILPIPLLKFKFKTWLLISRILWFLNLIKTERNFNQEVQRAKFCADLLYKQAQRNSVVLVSHGLLNIFIERYLKKQNYQRIYKVRSGCFSITKLESLI